MIKFFRICGIISFFGIIAGLSALCGSASANDLSGVITGISLAFSSFACGMLFLSVARLNERIEELESKKNDKL